MSNNNNNNNNNNTRDSQASAPDDDHPSSNINDSMTAASGAPGSHQPHRTAIKMVGNTVTDIKDSFSQFLLIKLWWRDIGRRAGSEYHYTTLFTGSTLIPLAILSYILAFEFNPPSGVDTEYRHYICASMAVTIVAQFFFTFTGICYENAAMLLAANVVAGAVALRIVVRPLLDNDNETGRKVERWIIEGITCFLVVVHFVASFLAWRANEGFRRFIFFAIGGTTRVQNRYRVYQAWSACSRVDIFFTILTCLSIGFYCGQIWWHYLLLVLIVLVNAIWRSLLLRVIRTETCIAECFQTSVVAGDDATDVANEETAIAQNERKTPMSSPLTEQEIVVGAAGNTTKKRNHMYSEKNKKPSATESNGDDDDNDDEKEEGPVFTNSQQLFGSIESRLEASGQSIKPLNPIPSWWSFILVAILNLNSPLVLGFALFSNEFIRTDIPDYSYFLVFMSFAFFLGARVLLTVATVFAWRNFGKGMKDVFEKERGVSEYLLGTRVMQSQRSKKRKEERQAAAAAGGATSISSHAPSVLGDDEDDDPFAAAAKSARNQNKSGYGTL